jgi:hypothetical protein
MSTDTALVVIDAQVGVVGDACDDSPSSEDEGLLRKPKSPEGSVRAVNPLQPRRAAFQPDRPEVSVGTVNG